MHAEEKYFFQYARFQVEKEKNITRAMMMMPMTMTMMKGGGVKGFRVKKRLLAVKKGELKIFKNRNNNRYWQFVRQGEG